AAHFGICVGSAKSLVLKGILPATQAIKGSQWLVPVDALSSETVCIAVQRVIERRPKNYIDYQYDRMIRLPGIPAMHDWRDVATAMITTTWRQWSATHYSAVSGQ